MSYGCYLGTCYDVAEFPCIEDAERCASDGALEETERWVGMHGFCDFDEEDFESEDEYYAAVEEEIQYAAESYVEEYDPEKHDEFLH